MAQYGARAFINSPETAYEYLDNCNSADMFIEKGEAIYKYLVTDAKGVFSNSFKINVEYQGETIRCLAINKERFNPVNFGIDYHKLGYKAFLCFHYSDETFNFSIYNDDNSVDCSIIAKRLGGGGHKGASGMRLTPEQFFEFIRTKEL